LGRQVGRRAVAIGAIWLHSLDDWFAAEGIPFREYPGWLTRSRSSGGFDQVWGIIAHHTASNTSWQSDCSYMWVNAGTRPIGNVHLDRAGVWTLGAAGATNTAGAGLAPWQTSKGVIPTSPSSMGNRMTFNIEAANNGVGERWPKAQVDSYMAGMAMLCRRLGLVATPDVTTHRGWAGTRKSDPFGPAEGYPNLGSQFWSIPALRDYVRVAGTPPPLPPDPTPSPPTSLTEGTLDMVLVAKFGGTPTANWAGWFSPNGGISRYPIRNMHQAQLLVALGAIDGSDAKRVTDPLWSDVGHTADEAELSAWIGPPAV
jgi:hypothetical protein